MNTLLRLFDCTYKIFFTVQCKYGLTKLYGEKSKKKSRSRLAEMLENAIGEIICFGILAYGVFKGWVEIPPYLSDGYDFDNFAEVEVLKAYNPKVDEKQITEAECGRGTKKKRVF